MTYNRKREKRIRAILHCPTCGAMRLFVRSGLVCPKEGCGRIVSVDDDIARSLRLRRAVPYATAIRGRLRLFSIDYHHESAFWRFAPRRWQAAGVVEARYKGRIRRFVAVKLGAKA